MSDDLQRTSVNAEFRDNLVRLIRSGSSAIIVRTNEYEPLSDAVQQVVSDPTNFGGGAADAATKAFHTLRWNPARSFFRAGDAIDPMPVGFDKPADDPIAALQAITNRATAPHLPRAVFIMTELHMALASNNPKLRAIFKGIVDRCENSCAYDNNKFLRRPIIVVVPPLEKLPEDIESRLAPLDWPLPDGGQIRTVLGNLEGSRRDKGKRLDPPEIARVASTALGLPLTVIESVYAQTVVQTGAGNVGDLLNRFELAKSERIGQDGTLLYVPSHELPRAADIGGFEGAVDFVRESAQAYLEEAKGILSLPRGSVLLGLPGTGKSLFGKVTASILEDVTGSRFMFYFLNVSGLFGSLVGQTEARLREVFRTLRAQGKYVLMIDEMEKLLRGGEGTGDSGVAARVNAMLLTWMNDRVSDPRDQGYIIGTMNSTNGVPPEFFRRFDCTFFADLPTPEVRRDIFQIHLRRRNIALDAVRHEDGSAMLPVDWTALLEATHDFLGSEVEDVVLRATRRAFSRRRSNIPTVSELIEAARGRATSALAKTHAEEVKAIRAFASEQATPVTGDPGVARVAPPSPPRLARRVGKSVE